MTTDAPSKPDTVTYREANGDRVFVHPECRIVIEAGYWDTETTEGDDV